MYSSENVENSIIESPVGNPFLNPRISDDLAKCYDPIESHPDWDLIASPGSKLTKTKICGGVIHIYEDTSPARTLIYKGMRGVNVEASGVMIMSPSLAGGFLSFPIAIRITNQGDYIGLRAWQGNIDFYEVINNGYTPLIKVPYTLAPSHVALKAIGSQVTCSVNGVDHVRTTNHTASGAIGMVARKWETEDIRVLIDYDAKILP